MAKRKNEPVKAMVNGKERTIVGKRAYPRNLLEAFERIIEAGKDTKMNDDFFITVGLDIRYITQLLNISPLQAVFLSFLIYKCEDTRIRPSEIAEFFGIKAVLGDFHQKIYQRVYLPVKLPDRIARRRKVT